MPRAGERDPGLGKGRMLLGQAPARVKGSFPLWAAAARESGEGIGPPWGERQRLPRPE